MRRPTDRPKFMLLYRKSNFSWFMYNIRGGRTLNFHARAQNFNVHPARPMQMHVLQIQYNTWRQYTIYVSYVQCTWLLYNKHIRRSLPLRISFITRYRVSLTRISEHFTSASQFLLLFSVCIYGTNIQNHNRPQASISLWIQSAPNSRYICCS